MHSRQQLKQNFKYTVAIMDSTKFLIVTYLFHLKFMPLNRQVVILATILMFCVQNDANLTAPHTVRACSTIWPGRMLHVVEEEPDRAPYKPKPEGIVTLTEQFLNYFLGGIKLIKKKKKDWFNLNLIGANELICNVMKLILWVNLKRKLIFFPQSQVNPPAEPAVRICANKRNRVTMVRHIWLKKKEGLHCALCCTSIFFKISTDRTYYLTLNIKA